MVPAAAGKSLWLQTDYSDSLFAASVLHEGDFYADIIFSFFAEFACCICTGDEKGSSCGRAERLDADLLFACCICVGHENGAS